MTPCKSVCTYTVTHSDQRSERCVKIYRFRLPIWTYNYHSNNWVGQSMSPKRCGLINHLKKVSCKYWVPVLKVKAGIVRSTTPIHMAALPVRSYNRNQAITHRLKRVLLGLLKDPQTPQATTQLLKVGNLAIWALVAPILAANQSQLQHGRDLFAASESEPLRPKEWQPESWTTYSLFSLLGIPCLEYTVIGAPPSLAHCPAQQALETQFVWLFLWIK